MSISAKSSRELKWKKLVAVMRFGRGPRGRLRCFVCTWTAGEDGRERARAHPPYLYAGITRRAGNG